jgi:ABC-2 type transport system ATP-binding protein
MLEARQLAKYYHGTAAVKDVSFQISPGEILGYLGPNGAGKSTTVGILTGLIEPSSGTVLYNGVDISHDLVEYRRHIGYVPEEPNLYPFLSGREYLELVGRLREMSERPMRRTIDGFLDLLGLGGARDMALSAYSKGMRQKVLIAAALMHDPEVLIFDEPLTGLDVTAALVFRRLVSELGRAGKIVLYSSHVLEVVEKICTRVLVLYRGRVVAHDTVGRLRDLMALDSLEQVFTELVVRDDPNQTAREMVSLMASGREAS